TRIAASLCRMLDDADKRMQAPLAVVDAHIDAIKAVVRDKIQTDDHPVGRDLVETLEARAAEHLG
ncbi:MAG: Hpt domain-containing protein, partial [Brevundimonas diminuta]